MATDYGRLEKAFTKIESLGIIAKTNFWCCQSCACCAIANDHGNDAPYVFWHEQDHESAFANMVSQDDNNDDDDNEVFCGFTKEYDEDMTGDLYIAHGNLSFRQKSLVVETIEKAGFEVEWDKTDNLRIKVLNCN